MKGGGEKKKEEGRDECVGDAESRAGSDHVGFWRPRRSAFEGRRESKEGGKTVGISGVDK